MNKKTKKGGTSFLENMGLKIFIKKGYILPMMLIIIFVKVKKMI